MKIVIEIDDELYKEYVCVQFARGNGKSIVYNLLKAVKKGTPLPEHHGRLKDIDAFITKVKADRKHSAYLKSWTADDVLKALDNSYAPTIIEESDNNDKRVHT